MRLYKMFPVSDWSSMDVLPQSMEAGASGISGQDAA